MGGIPPESGIYRLHEGTARDSAKIWYFVPVRRTFASMTFAENVALDRYKMQPRFQEPIPKLLP